MVRKKVSPYDTDFSYLQTYYQKGGTYILPVEVVSDLTGQIEDLVKELNNIKHTNGSSSAKSYRKDSKNN